MHRIYLLLICFLALSSAALAQTDFTGRVLEIKTRVGLADISIQNLKTTQITRTDNRGRFAIKANLNDLLVITGFQYDADTVLVSDHKYTEIFLYPKGTLLKNVTVHNTQAEASSKMGSFNDPEYHGQAIVKQRDRMGLEEGGIDIRIHYWTKDDKKRKKIIAMQKEEGMREEIARVFTAQNITNYLPLKGTDLDDFILLYTPKTKVYFAADFNMLLYLDTNYKEFLKLTPEQRKQGRLVQ